MCGGALTAIDWLDPLLWMKTRTWKTASNLLEYFDGTDPAFGRTAGFRNEDEICGAAQCAHAILSHATRPGWRVGGRTSEGAQMASGTAAPVVEARAYAAEHPATGALAKYGDVADRRRVRIRPVETLDGGTGGAS